MHIIAYAHLDTDSLRHKIAIVCSQSVSQQRRDEHSTEIQGPATAHSDTTGTEEEAMDYIKERFYLGITGFIT